jgi:hypothetical protein
MEYFENEKDPLQSLLDMQEKVVAGQTEDQEKNRAEHKKERERLERESKVSEKRFQSERENARLTSLFGFSFSLCPQQFLTPQKEWELHDSEAEGWEEWAKSDASLKALWIKEFWRVLSEDTLSSIQFLSLLGVNKEKDPNVDS